MIADVDAEATRSPRELFEELAALIAQGRWSELGPLYADDVVVRNPFVADGPSMVVGRAAVEQFFGFLAGRVRSLRVDDTTIHETTNREVIVVEFCYRGTGADGAEFVMPAVFVLRVQDGRIVESRDYTGPRREVTSQD